MSCLLVSLLLSGCTYGEGGEGGEGGEWEGGGDEGGGGGGGNDTGTTGTDTGTVDTSTGGDTSAPTDDFCGVKTILAAHCASCHDSTSPSGGLDLQTDPYAALVSVPSGLYGGRTLVVPGSAATSFLYLKMTDAQGGDGVVMPMSGVLPASLTDVVRTWIDNGASSSCSTPDTGTGGDTGTSGGYHPTGWSDPSQHGFAAKFQTEDCKSCHGSDLSGGSVGVSCSSCHTSGWQTDCTFCHGGTDGDTQGAPPEDLDDSTTSLTFSAHHAHTEDTALHDAFSCAQCHTTHRTALESSHFLDTADSAPGTAEMTFTAGLSPSAKYSAGTCSNLYCHGDGTGSNGTMKSTGSVTSCEDCHRSSGLNGKHGDHLGEGVGCAECHSDTASSNTKIKDPSKHVDGNVDVALTAGMTWSGGKCDGSCHGERHSSRTW